MSKKGFLTHIFGLILILISLFLGPPVNAGSIFEAPKVSIPKPEEVVPSEYSFIAKFNSEKTQLQPFGDGWETTHFTWGNGTVETYLSLRPTQSQKGMNGVVYSHVGSFGGKIIDLKITIKDWQQFSRYQGYISYSKEDISHFAQGYDFVDQEWAFVDHATGLPIAVSGFMTINDIDGGQGFQFSKETFEAITHIYVAAEDNWINYQENEGEHRFFESRGTASENEDLFATFTFLYKDQSSLRFKWCVEKSLIRWDYQNLNFEKDYKGNPGYQGAYFGYVAKKPLRTEILQPIKKNSDSDELLVDKNTLENRKEKQTYTITHQVSDEYPEFYYTSYEFSDILDPAFEIQRVEIIDETGKDVRALFSLVTEGNQLHYSANKESLTTSNFYNHYYTTVITAAIRPDVSLPFIAGVAQLKNRAAIEIDGTKRTTNETLTEVPEEELATQEPFKRVVDQKGQEINGAVVAPGDLVVYEIDQKVHTLQKDIFAKYTSFSIKDVLPTQLEFQSAQILKNGKAIEALNIAYDPSTHTVLFEGDDTFLKGMDMKNEVYTLQIRTKVIEEVGKDEQIVNSAKVTINNQDKETNQVTNTTTLPTGKITLTKTTNQPVGVKKDTNDVVDFQWDTLPQGEVVYRVTAHKEIVFPNGEVVAQQGADFGTITTDNHGEATIKELYAGEYAFTEISAPAGIQINQEPVIVTLLIPDKGGPLEARVQHEDQLQQVNLKIHKVFQEDNGSYSAADGAVFGLFYGETYKFSEQDRIEADALVSKIEIFNGVGSYTGVLLPNQAYYIRELTTRPEYKLKDQRFEFVYMPTSNDSLHEIQLFENGWTENGQRNNYQANQRREKDAEGGEAETEMQPIKNDKITENSIVKSIVKPDGIEVDNYDIPVNTEQVTFKGIVYLGAIPLDAAVEVSDELPKDFSYQSSKVYDDSGNDITDQVSILPDDQKVTLRLKRKEAASLEAKSITWVLETSYRRSSAAQESYNNQMNLTVNDAKYPSNIVTLSAPMGNKPQGQKGFPETGESISWMGVIGVMLVLTGCTLWYKQVKSKQE